jgi:uncharacterized protein with von Willebrand factor type A (vWA) domain
MEQRLNPPLVQLSSMHGGTALYDAVAVSLCRLRGTNIRQAVVVITDGADQNSPFADRATDRPRAAFPAADFHDRIG